MIVTYTMRFILCNKKIETSNPIPPAPITAKLLPNKGLLLSNSEYNNTLLLSIPSIFGFLARHLLQKHIHQSFLVKHMFVHI